MRTVFLITLLTLYSCKTSQSGQADTSGQQVDSLSQLNNRWLLDEVNGVSVDQLTYNFTPTIEINTEEKRINGSDGCNNFFGQLDQLDQNIIEIGLMGSTKAICPGIKDADLLGKYLSAVKTYRVDKQHLRLYDEAGREVLRYKLSE